MGILNERPNKRGGAEDSHQSCDYLPVAASSLTDFFRVPKDSPLRTQEGVYDARVFGSVGKRAQIVLLDTRYFRSALKLREPPDPRLGRYVANTDPSSTILGEARL